MFGKWNSSGELTWIDGDILYAADLRDSIDETTPPIGAVIPWLKSFTGVPATLPSGWVECNGQVLSDADSPLNGQTMPDLNVTQRFLRGSSTSGTTGGGDTHNHTYASGGDMPRSYDVDYYHSIQSASTLPAFYECVFIIRIK